MSDQFYKQPILNSPYGYPSRHWHLDSKGIPTQRIVESRRLSKLISPIPKPRQAQKNLALDEIEGADDQLYAHSKLVNELRHTIDAWRRLPPSKWRVTPETARLLAHWRSPRFSGVRPFFCQIEAVETAIWLHEVAPTLGKSAAPFLEHLKQANLDANPGLLRLALKLATGAGKTTVMAMLIAWQTINAVRHPRSEKFTCGFLLVAPGITIKDRLRVLLPNDADSYYASRELVPRDMLPDLDRAVIVITNYHAFKRRERADLPKAAGRRLMKGRRGRHLETLESEGAMLQRVIRPLMRMKNILVVNDEAHHCYREKPGTGQDDKALDKNQKREAAENNEAARVWISGLEAVNRKIGLQKVIDLSATPFFLAGSGYKEGTLFPWTMSDFSLMDAIECGIVKLPRVPIADNVPNLEMPMYRDLWQHVGKKMPKKGRGKSAMPDPLDIPDVLKNALDALYGHYAKEFDCWRDAGVSVPPCFIVVCNNTATSKLVFDYISGFTRADGSFEQGRLALFCNFDGHGEPLARPNTLLIDSVQLESGEALDDSFRSMAGDEIERFKREIIERTGNREQTDNLSDSDILREVMNTVGKPGRLGEQIRCVVSVSMLSEGWDANTVTHILGVRAFGTQLLCEQVMGRALRRRAYDVNEQGLFNVEYADVFGIPFDFASKPVDVTVTPPRDIVTVRALRPERDHLEIRFPRVLGYRAEVFQNKQLDADFSDDHGLTLTPALVGATQTHNAGIVGATVELNIDHLGEAREASLVMALTNHLLQEYWRESGKPAPITRFGEIKRLVRRWLDECLICEGGTSPAQLRNRQLASMACERINKAITDKGLAEQGSKMTVMLDAFNPVGSTAHVHFNTSSDARWDTVGLSGQPKNHVNWVMLDSDWEREFCRVAESHPKVLAYTKNHNLGLEVPYRMGSVNRTYIPDFIVKVDDGRGRDAPLNLIVEVKGVRFEDAKEKALTMRTYWIPGVNRLGTHGRWAFVELRDVDTMQADFDAAVQGALQANP